MSAPVQGCVGWFDLAASGPGRDLTGNWDGLIASGHLQFTAYGAVFHEDGALCSERYRGPTLDGPRTYIVWFARHGSRPQRGALLCLEQTSGGFEALSSDDGDSGDVHFRKTDANGRNEKTAGAAHPSSLDAVGDHWAHFTPAYVVHSAGGVTIGLGDTVGGGSSTPLLTFEPEGTKLWIGPMGHAAGSGSLEGIVVAEVRVYDRALSGDEISAVRQEFIHRRKLRARVVAGTLPRFCRMLHAGPDNRLIGNHHYYRVSPTPDGAVVLDLAMVEQQADAVAPHYTFRRLTSRVLDGEALLDWLDTRCPRGAFIDGAVCRGERRYIPDQAWEVVPVPDGRVCLWNGPDADGFLRNESDTGNEDLPSLARGPEWLHSGGMFVAWAPHAAAHMGFDFAARDPLRSLPIGPTAGKPVRFTSTGEIVMGPGGVYAASGTSATLSVDVPRLDEPFTLLVWVMVQEARATGDDPLFRAKMSLPGTSMGEVDVVRLKNRTWRLSQPQEDRELADTNADHRADGVTLLAIHVDPDRLVSITTEAGAEVEAPFAFPPFDPFAMFMGSIPDPPQPSDADYGLELTLGKGTTLTALEIFRGRMGRSERLWRDLSVRDRKARQCASDAQRLAHRFRLGTPKSNQVVDFTPGVRTLTWNAVHKSTSVVEASIEGGEVVLGYGSYDTLGPDDAGALKMFGRTYAMQGMKVYRLSDGFFAFRAPNGQFLSHGEPLRATDPDFPPPIEDDQKWRIRPVVNT